MLETMASGRLLNIEESDFWIARSSYAHRQCLGIPLGCPNTACRWNFVYQGVSADCLDEGDELSYASHALWNVRSSVHER